MRAAVLAAGPADKLNTGTPGGYKALVPIHGRPMVGYVIDALRAAEHVSRVVVVCGPDGLLPAEALRGSEQVRATSGSFSDTVATAARAAGGGLLVLATADVPFLTAAAVDETAKFALDSGADLTYTIADVRQVAAAFPGTKRTSLRLREGRFTGGNLVVARSEALLQSLETIQAAFARRKSVVGLAALLGPMLILRLTLGFLGLGLLDVEAIAARGSQILGCSVAVHLTAHPEVAFDVDKPTDLAVAEAVMVKEPV